MHACLHEKHLRWTLSLFTHLRLVKPVQVDTPKAWTLNDRAWKKKIPFSHERWLLSLSWFLGRKTNRDVGNHGIEDAREACNDPRNETTAFPLESPQLVQRGAKRGATWCNTLVTATWLNSRPSVAIDVAISRRENRRKDCNGQATINNIRVRCIAGGPRGPRGWRTHAYLFRDYTILRKRENPGNEDRYGTGELGWPIWHVKCNFTNNVGGEGLCDCFPRDWRMRFSMKNVQSWV